MYVINTHTGCGCRFVVVEVWRETFLVLDSQLTRTGRHTHEQSACKLSDELVVFTNPCGGLLRCGGRVHRSNTVEPGSTQTQLHGTHWAEKVHLSCSIKVKCCCMPIGKNLSFCPPASFTECPCSPGVHQRLREPSPPKSKSFRMTGVHLSSPRVLNRFKDGHVRFLLYRSVKI